MQKTLLVLVGPTAVGKTAVAIALAQHFASEVVSADSRQVYSEMRIGTARPLEEELAGVPHHFLGTISIQQNYTVADYAKQANEVINTLFLKHDLVIFTGGSGLYIDALCNGLDDLPNSNPEIKSQLLKILKEQGIAKLQEQLLNLDPEYYHTMDLNNPHRLVRAIEICLLTGNKFSALRSGKKVQHPYRIVKIGLTMDRALLYNRINLRVEQMMQNGLLEEARSLLPFRDKRALNTVGYTELFKFFDGELSLENAISLIQQNSRRYAKRQITWFKKDSQTSWLDASDTSLVLKKILDELDKIIELPH